MIVSHRNGQYSVDFFEAEEWSKALPAYAVWVTDSHVEKYLPFVPSDRLIVVPAGESSKSTSQYIGLLEKLAERRIRRDGLLVAVGGGVIGDLVGFAAATYMRGISYVGIPTTLLAMVDSSIGGKVGIDLGAGKNLVGAFHPPTQVRVCVDLLKTLPQRQFRNGLAEVLKYGFISTPQILDLAEQADANDGPLLEKIVSKCLECKKYVVENDENERSGLRATLNFGHTIGHAIETKLNYKDLLHGEAIAVGMVAETVLAEHLGLAPKGLAGEIGTILIRHGLPVWHEELEGGAALVELMKLDKKASQSGLTFALVSQMGACQVAAAVPESEVLLALEATTSRFKGAIQ